MHTFDSVHELIGYSVEEVLDVCGLDPPKQAPYDTSKAHQLMEECQRYLSIVRMTEIDDDWEDKVSKYSRLVIAMTAPKRY